MSSGGGSGLHPPTGVPSRGATREQLAHLNARAREAGFAHVADDALIWRMPPDGIAAGVAVGPADDDRGLQLVSWMIPPADLERDAIEYALIDVRPEDLTALPEFEAVLADRAGPEAGSGWPLLLGFATLAGIVFVVARLAAPGAVSTVGVAVAASGVLICAVAGGLMAFDARRSDYWDSLDQFFGQLELIYVGAAGLAIALAGGLVAILGQLM